MKKLQKIIIEYTTKHPSVFVCTKNFLGENPESEIQQIPQNKIADYFVSLKNHYERTKDFVVEIEHSSENHPQQNIQQIYKIFSQSFEQKIHQEPEIADTIESSSPWPLYIKEHNLMKLKMHNLIFIDCETTGLYGEYLSFALLFYNQQNATCHAYYIRREDVQNLENVHPFVTENVITRMDLKKLADYEKIKSRFTQNSEQKEKIYLKEKTVSGEENLLKESARILKEALQSETEHTKNVLLAESPYPVEFRFIEKMFKNAEITAQNKIDFAERLHDWYSVKINAEAPAGEKEYQRSIHNALVDVLVNYDEYIKMEGR